MRDNADNFVVVCSIENIDPMGIHTGDSITVAPAQTLTDREYQVLRDLARRVMDAVGVETGGSNVQFAVDPLTGRTLVIEMNPRVSRSSALASKATGFPIAKLAALVAVGYTLAEITNDITQQTKAAFEPSLDYVVVKIPRWAFEKFPGVDATLGPQMKSVGEVMALGRTFPEALMKAVQSLEVGIDALDGSGQARSVPTRLVTLDELRVPTADRLFARVPRHSSGNSPRANCFAVPVTTCGSWRKCRKYRNWKKTSVCGGWITIPGTRRKIPCLPDSPPCYALPSSMDLPTIISPGCYPPLKNRWMVCIYAISDNVRASCRHSNGWTPVRQSLMPRRPIFTAHMKSTTSHVPPTVKRSSSWVEGRTGLVRVSSLITAAARRLMHCLKWGLRRLCTIVTRKRYPPIMIPPTGCILSH